MPSPAGWSYSQLVFETEFGYNGMGTSPSAPNSGKFTSNTNAPTPDTSVGLLNDWNFGMQEQPGAVWSLSGSNPYVGSSIGCGNTWASGIGADYSFPGSVFQTSTGENPLLLGGYSPQTFTSQGTGLTLWDHYVGGPLQIATQTNGAVCYYTWWSGMLNTEGKRFFPFGGATEFYAQVSAQMAGPNNGSWSGIWMLPDLGEGGTGQPFNVQSYNVEGPNADAMYSQANGTALSVGTSSTPLYAGYHTYGWDVDTSSQTVTMYLDGVQAATYTGSGIGSMYFLVLDAEVSSGQQSWESSESFVTNSNADMAMSVAEVQVYQP
jgi:hypothetical protein